MSCSLVWSRKTGKHPWERMWGEEAIETKYLRKWGGEYPVYHYEIAATYEKLTGIELDDPKDALFSLHPQYSTLYTALKVKDRTGEVPKWVEYLILPEHRSRVFGD